MSLQLRLTHVHVTLQHIPHRQHLGLIRFNGTEAGFVERFLGKAVRQHQPIKHPAFLNDPLDVGIKLDERRFKEPTATKGNSDLTREAVEFAASVFESLIQLLVDGFLERLEEESEAGAHDPVGGRPGNPE